MTEIFTMGELIVEIMRDTVDSELYVPGKFLGPYPSGAPAIYIDTAARLGHSSAMIGSVGDDDFGKCLLDRFKRDGVDTDYITTGTNSTGCAFVTYYTDGSRKFIFHIGNSAAGEASAPSADAFKDTKLFHIMGCSLMASPAFGSAIVSAMKAAVSCGASVSFDPNIRPELMKDDSSRSLITEVLSMTEIFLPGLGELLSITGKDTLEDAIDACFAYPRMKIVAVKNGSKGCMVYDREGRTDVGIFEITPLDATGAGDCFDAAFTCSLLEGRNIKEAAIRASAAAAMNTAAFGPMEGDISVEKLEKFIAERNLPTCTYQARK